MADGQILINTRIDTTGIRKGTTAVGNQFGKLESAAKRLGNAIAGTFAIRQVIAFGKSASSAASELSSAMMGLQSIVEGQGRSFASAQAFIDEYIQDGLIPATNAITAYKNLASRGYDDAQIRQVMTALKDASAFGRQASLTMGDAVQTATEGLRQENSVLVDNAGVTKNVAKMWEEYAQSIGTTADKLTQQQKIQAEVTGILQETRFQTGDAAKVANTFAGQVQRLSFAFNDFKVAVGNIINPIAQVLLPVLTAAITQMTRFANAAASVVSALTGKSAGTAAKSAQSIADGYASAAENASGLAEASEKAAEAAKRSAAGFDEMQILSSDTGAGASAGSVSGVSVLPDTVVADSEVQDNLSPKIQTIVDRIRALLEPLRNLEFAPAQAALAALGTAFETLGTTIGSGLEWAWFNILVPLAGWTIEEAGPAALDALSAALGVMNSTLVTLQPLGIWLWDNFLQPIAEWTGGLIADILTAIADGLTGISNWISEHQALVEGMAVTAGIFSAAWNATTLMTWIINAGSLIGVLKNLGAAIMAGTVLKLKDKAVDLALIALYAKDWLVAVGGTIAKLAASTGAWVANTAAKVASTAAEWAQIAATTAWKVICIAATGVTTAFGAAMAFLTSPITLVILAIGALIAIIVLLVKNWDTVKATAIKVWEAIKKAWGSFTSWFSRTIVQPMVSGFKGAVNSVIGFINGMISAVISGINTVLRAFNKLSFDIPDWVPVLGGKKFGFSFQMVTPPKIPYLAQGAVIPPNREFLAVLGDQKHGTNLEAPEALIRKIVREESGGGGADRPIVFVLKIGKRTLGKAVVDSINELTRQNGELVLELG
ncbi:MAG: hypothetical protein IJY28_01525 [Clostridia bacterium]|nr:hypothetical protein [Clostridia bacterium]